MLDKIEGYFVQLIPDIPRAEWKKNASQLN